MFAFCTCYPVFANCLNSHPSPHDVTGMVTGLSHNESPRGKTNNVVSEQVRHKPTCTNTEKS